MLKPNIVRRERLTPENWSKFLSETGSRFFFSAKNRDALIQGYREYFPHEYQATLQVAQQLLAHRITIFGSEFYLGEKIDWHRDPKTGNLWPYKFYADIDTRDGKTIGGVKWVWELNRHYHLVTLAKAYFLTNKEQYAQEVCAQLEDWIDANPPGFGVNWTSSLELALRIINWLWVLAFIKQSLALTQTLLETILQSIVEQANYITRHLSVHSSANNHLIGEVAGLAFAGMCFPWLPQADKWCETGLTIMAREIELQIHPDGVPAEQAIDYLAFVLDFNLLVWRLADLNGLGVPQMWYDRLSVACDFIQHLVDDAGNIPHIGDSDDAWVVRLDERTKTNNFQSILTSAAILLNRPDLKAIANRWDEKNFWLLGIDGRKLYQQLPNIKVQHSSHLFNVGGYAIMRAVNQVVVFDCAPLGYLSTAAHGHADALNVLLSVGGQPLLIDPNTYAYQEGYEWRDYFRSTAAHNTVVVDNQNQSELQGTFLWGKQAETKCLQWQSVPEYDLVIAEHNGYQDCSIIHRRALFFVKPDWLVVMDTLLGNKEHNIEQFWHFPADSELQIASTEAFLQSNGKIKLRLWWQNQALHAQMYQGEKSPLQGWVSSHYGQLDPAPALGLSYTGKLPVKLETTFYFGSLIAQDEIDKKRSEILGSWKNIEKEVLQ